MTTYCPTCGYKNSYTGLKPTECEACGELLERKIRHTPKQTVNKDGDPGYDPIQEDPTGIGIELDPRSIQVQKDNGFLTIGKLRSEGGEVFTERGNPQEIAAREETLNTLLGRGISSSTPPPPPDKKPRSTARMVPSRIAPPPE